MNCVPDTISTLQTIRDAVDAAIVALRLLTPQADQPRPPEPAPTPGRGRSKVRTPRAKAAAKKLRATRKAPTAVKPAKSAPPAAATKVGSAGDSVATRILHLMAERGGSLKGREIAALLDLDTETTKRALRQLRDAGQLALSGATSSARWSPAAQEGAS